MAQKPSIPKGTRDFGQVEMARRNYIFDTIKSVFSLYGFQQIETPAMENIGTLMGKYGEEGDKLLFRVQNSAMTASDIATRMTADKATFTVKIGETEWATLTSDKILNFDGISGLTANVVSDYNTSTKSITVTPVTEVPAATPLLLNGNEGVYSVPVLASTSASIGTNYLVRGPGDEVGEATGTNTRFVLVVSGTNAVFKKIGDTKHPVISKEKAYLEIPAVLSARELSINLDGGGSATIWTNKTGILNHPYDNHKFDHEGARKVPNILVFR